MLYLYIEKGYRDFPWFQRSLTGLNSEARKRRIVLHNISSISDVPKDDAEAVVLLLGGTELWLKKSIEEINARDIYPISMTNMGYRLSDQHLSSISMDLQDSMRLAIDYYHSIHRTKLALYGVNPFSTSDPVRAACFCQLTGRNEHVYYIQNSYEHSFEAFKKNIELYDGVICCNDYAALSLVRNLKRIGVDPSSRLYVLGYGNMLLTQKSIPSVTSISDDYENFGNAALRLYNLVIKEKSFSTISIQLRSYLHIRETTGNEPYVATNKRARSHVDTAPNPFYNDQEIATMAKIEWLLNQCDETDLMILKNLMTRNSYADIAEYCFLSETATKYRVKKMEQLCGVDSRKALRDFLSDYM